MERDEPEDAADQSEPKRYQFPKQAVILVHGMGEQRPMDTIRSFVTSIWCLDRKRTKVGVETPGEVWSKPDVRTGSYELRRITTRESKASTAYPIGARTDFYELYWADLTAGSPWEEITSWVRGLLLRNPFKRAEVPRRVLLAWIFLWLATLLFVCAALLLLPFGGLSRYVADGWAWPRGIALAMLAFLLNRLRRSVTSGFGRVVRYTRSTPANIAARAAVRERGLRLLSTLHAREQGYTRIILVGHSLGSILAYELLGIFWAQQNRARIVEDGSREFQALCDLETAAARLAEGGDATEDWLRAQHEFRKALAARPHLGQDDPRWIISDFVTMGSPLTHASFLLAQDEIEFCTRKDMREFSTSPPFREVLNEVNLQKAKENPGLASAAKDGRLSCFPSPGRDGSWELHHATAFSAVRWTNIYDNSQFVVRGDQISGPLQPAFGPGIIDVDLRDVRGQARRFTHTRYWSPDAGEKALDCVRDALNLLDDTDSGPRRHVKVGGSAGKVPIGCLKRLRFWSRGARKR